MLSILLPSCISESRLDTALKIFSEIRTQSLETKKGGIQINWTRVEKISPLGFGILACLLDRTIEKQTTVNHRFIKKKFRDDPLIRKLVEAGKYSFLPPAESLNRVRDEMILEGLSNSISMTLPDRLIQACAPHLKDDLKFSVKLILNELMINTVDHSGSERYYVCAGRWEKEFHVGILDMGVTIPAKLEQKYPFADDRDALRLALKEGVSTRRSRTGGLGLTHTMESLKQHAGRLTIVSRGAQLRKYFSQRRSKATNLKHSLPGTWCFARFPYEEEGK